ncbi:MAG: acyltransferase [Flavobacteriales bacterium]|nr:acyltransferase [Flavobacteriales bacterium]
MSTQNSIRFNALDAWRGIAALAIAIFHFNTGWGGYLAVDFFLVLSGFILYHTYRANPHSITFRVFVVHRIARLYPLHLYSLLMYALGFLFVFGDLPDYAEGRWFTFIQHLLLVQGIGISPCGWNYPSWSISVEFWINMALFLFVSSKLKSVWLVAISIIGLIPIYYFTGHLDTHATNYFTVFNSGLLRGVVSFSLGIVAYRLYQSNSQQMQRLSYWKSSALEMAISLGVVLMLALRSEKHSELDFLAPFLFFLLVFVFARDAGIVSKGLAIFPRLGAISYSVYLNQMLVLMVLEPLFPAELNEGYIHFLVYVVILILYSELTYRMVETPMRKYIRNQWV